MIVQSAQKKEKSMPAIRSLEDLGRIREEAARGKKLRATPGNAQVSVGMGSCSRAVGAHHTLERILKYVENEKMTGVTVTQTGCIGLCEYEPIVQVIFGDQSRVVYRNVDAQTAERIMKQHVQNGQPVTESIFRI
jgi:NADP-reducing hydrogenase subunit HndB